MMDINHLVSLLMALIAASSAAISYLIYRSASDPEVIIYVEIDPNRPSLINLIIKNIGKGSAKDITFKSSRPIPHRSMGAARAEDNIKLMEYGPLIEGIPYLAPGQQIEFMWGQIGGLKEHLADRPIDIQASFYRGSASNCLNSPLTAISRVHVRQFDGCLIPENVLHNISKQLKDTNARLSSIEKSILKSKK